MIPRLGCPGGMVAAITRLRTHAAVRITRARCRWMGWDVLQARLLAGLSQGVG